MFGENLRVARKKLKLTQGSFAKPIGVTGSYVSDIEKGKGNPSEPVIRLIEKIYRINRHWLESGEDPMFRGPEIMLEWDNIELIDDRLDIGERDENTGVLTHRGDSVRRHKQDARLSMSAISKEQATQAEAERKAKTESLSIYKEGMSVDPETADLISSAGEILASDTDYADSLAAHIRSFHNTMTTEGHLQRIDNDMAEMKEMMKDMIGECKEIKKRLNKPDSKLRNDDRKEMSEQILKKREM